MKRSQEFFASNSRFAVAALAAGVMVAGCAGKPFDANKPVTVTSHTYTESYFYTIPMCAGYDSKGVCTVPMQIPMQEPEHYRINVEQCPEPKTTEDDCARKYIDVTPEKYASIEDGEVLYLNQDGDLAS